MAQIRKKCHTEFDKNLLLLLVSKYSEVENKKTDAVTIQTKARAWLNITSEFNNSTRISQKVDMKQLKKMWHNLKSKAREAKTIENQRHYTGGGPSQPEMGPEDSQVLATISKILPAIKVIDSDNVDAKDDDDDDSVSWLHHKTRNILKPNNNELMEIKEDLLTPTEKAATPAKIVPPATKSSSFKHKQATGTSSLEDIKAKILKQDLDHRQYKFELEMENQKINYQMENNHKKLMFRLLEEEQRLKIEILKKKLNDNAD